MAEVLAQFADSVVADEDGCAYRAQAVGAPMPDGLWEGWVEFVPLDGGAPIRTPRETTQPNFRDAAYWASGLTTVYLEGALDRALNPPIRRMPAVAEPMFDGPAPDLTVSTPRPIVGVDAVLDPFSVYEKGEVLLRKELGALSPWHLVNIIRAYSLSDEPIEVLNRLTGVALAQIIVEGVRADSTAR
jgi:hypothetical protein